jgi:RND superfamily putative drug exporter
MKAVANPPSRSRRSDPRPAFERLGRSVVRHPWRYLGFWLVLMLISLPAVASLGSVFSNSMSASLPNSDTSVVAQQKFSAEFPNVTQPPSSSTVLLVGNDITGPVGQNATLAVIHSIEGDPQVRYLGGMESLYSVYGEYLGGEADLGLGVLEGALGSTPSLPASLNLTAMIVWGPSATYVRSWEVAVAGLPAGSPPSDANWPAYESAMRALNASAVEEQILTTFYNGTPSVPGFNATVTPVCLTSHNVTPCADVATRTTFSTLLPTLFPNATERALPQLIVTDLVIENMTSWGALQGIGATLLGEETGLPSAFLLRLWTDFPNGTASQAAIMAWSAGIAEGTPVADWPLPAPRSILSGFVSPGNNATLLLVAFTKPDNFTEGGQTPIFQDVSRINTDGPAALASSPAYDGIAFYQTGSAPLDDAVSYEATSTLGLLLVLTIALLVVIMMIYFRAPAAPGVTFLAIGVAMLVTLAGLYLVGRYVTTISSLLESILLVFLMAIVTDYSIFMMARYREELVRGRTSSEALVLAVRWAGQSITTSGLTVFVVAIALTFSGLSFLSQLGMALAIAVVVAILAGLTVIPAVLRLVGPRVFWPYTGDRFARHAKQRRHHIRSGRTYFSWAGRTATRHPIAILLVIALLSVPIVFVAVNVPVSYDLTNTGLPSSDAAQKGLTVFEQQFGQSSLSSSYVLVTFSAPLITGGMVDAQEFEEVASLTGLMNSTPGISQVGSLVGPGGGPLSAWLNLSSLPIASRTALLMEVPSYIGVDGKTVQFLVVTAGSGYSAAASTTFGTLEDKVRSFQSGHPDVSAVYFGGAAPTTADYQTLTNNAMTGMLLGAVIGIFVVLLVILGAAFVPVLALGAIGLSIVWSWALVYYVVGVLEGVSLLFFLPLILIVLVLGLGMDYNALFLTRVKEERLKGYTPIRAVRRAVTHAGGVITAAAVILGGPFLILGLTSSLGLVAAIGLGIGLATLLQAFVAQTYLTPAILSVGKDRIWWGFGKRKTAVPDPKPALTTQDKD